MGKKTRETAEKKMDEVIGNILRIGVVTAAAIVLLGGIIYLAGNAHSAVGYRTFAAAAYPHKPADIIAKAASFNGYGIIQLGLLVLIATPIARVLFSAAAFALQKDFVYAAFTLAVFGLLIYSLVWHGMK